MNNGACIKERYNLALESFTERLKRDKYIISLMLCGSLSYDEVWEKSDIDVIIILSDEKKPFQIKSLIENDIIINAFIYSRNEFRRVYESSVRSDMFHSWFSKSKLLFTKDDVIKEYYDNICKIGENDKELQLLNNAIFAIAGLSKAQKFLYVKNDPINSFLWIMRLSDNLASIEVILKNEIPLREVVQQALKYNPGFFDMIHTNMIQQRKEKQLVENAIKAIEEYIKNKSEILFNPIIRFLSEFRNERSLTEINEYLGKRISIDPTLLVEACEWMVEIGMIQKVPVPVRLSSKSREELDEVAYYIMEVK